MGKPVRRPVGLKWSEPVWLIGEEVCAWGLIYYKDLGLPVERGR